MAQILKSFTETDGNLALKAMVVSTKPCDTNRKKDESTEVFPLKDIKDIEKIKNYFLANERYREYAWFTIGINTGLRCGDIVLLKWETFFDSTGQLYNEVTVREHKTKKFRNIFLNGSVVKALTLYREHTDLCIGYLFESQRNVHLNENTIYRYLKDAAKLVGIKINVGSHTIRKTFGYHQYKTHAPTNPRFIYELQKLFGHSSSEVTLCYIGITSERNEEYYNDVNL